MAFSCGPYLQSPRVEEVNETTAQSENLAMLGVRHGKRRRQHRPHAPHLASAIDECQRQLLEQICSEVVVDVTSPRF